MSYDRELLQDALAYVDTWFSYRLVHLKLPGFTVAVQYEDEMVFSKAYGYADTADETPMTTDHVMHVASHSKWFTATALCMLRDEGKLRLDDRLGDHLDWLPQGKGQAGRVTLREVMGHVAGISRDTDDASYWQLQRAFPEVEQFRETLANEQTVIPANELFKYSNNAYGALGQVIEAVTGTPYADFVTERIIEPLGLPDTRPDRDETIAARIPTGYSRPYFDLPSVPLDAGPANALNSATGFCATTEDLCRFGAAHFYGNEAILSDESKREMHHGAWKPVGDDEHYGLGTIVEEINGTTFIGHSGGYPGFTSNTRVDPRGKLAVSVAVSRTFGPAITFSSVVIGLIQRAMKQPQVDATKRAELDRYTGRFFSTWGATDVVRLGGSLIAVGPSADTPLLDITTLEVEGPDRLRMTECNGYDSPGEAVTYTRDGDDILAVKFGGVEMLPYERFKQQFGF